MYQTKHNKLAVYYNTQSGRPGSRKAIIIIHAVFGFHNDNGIDLKAYVTMALLTPGTRHGASYVRYLSYYDPAAAPRKYGSDPGKGLVHMESRHQ